MNRASRAQGQRRIGATDVPPLDWGKAPQLATPAVPGVPVIRITIGEIGASAAPLLIQTLLGSCVAVCLHDSLRCLGGMNHILLPGESDDPRFGVHAMELLINKLMQLGGDRRRFVAKSFGAGNVLPCLKPPTVGERNVEFVRRFLATEGIPLVAQRHGGTRAVRVGFRTDTGMATVHNVDGTPLSRIVATERAYLSRPQPVHQDTAALLF